MRSDGSASGPPRRRAPRPVATVLEQADFTVTFLEEDKGDTTSADLLVEFEGSHRLVEVKSSGGAAPEKLVPYLLRHLNTWPELRPKQPVEGGVLGSAVSGVPVRSANAGAGAC